MTIMMAKTIKIQLYKGTDPFSAKSPKVLTAE